MSAIAASAVLTRPMDATGTFSRAELKADATASGRQFPNGIGLSGAASAARDGGKGVALGLADAGTGTDRRRSRRRPPTARSAWPGTVELNLRDTDLAPFALGRSPARVLCRRRGKLRLRPVDRRRPCGGKAARIRGPPGRRRRGPRGAGARGPRGGLRHGAPRGLPSRRPPGHESFRGRSRSRRSAPSSPSSSTPRRGVLKVRQSQRRPGRDLGQGHPALLAQGRASRVGLTGSDAQGSLSCGPRMGASCCGRGRRSRPRGPPCRWRGRRRPRASSSRPSSLATTPRRAGSSSWRPSPSAPRASRCSRWRRGSAGLPGRAGRSRPRARGARPCPCFSRCRPPRRFPGSRRAMPAEASRRASTPRRSCASSWPSRDWLRPPSRESPFRPSIPTSAPISGPAGRRRSGYRCIWTTAPA